MPTVPACVGTYEAGHTTCDGDPHGATEEERVACAWRNRCVGLSLHCIESGARPEEVVGAVSYETLVALCEARVETAGIVAGRPENARDQATPTRETPASASPDEPASRAFEGVRDRPVKPAKAKPAKPAKPAKRKSWRVWRAPVSKGTRPIRSPKGPLPDAVLALSTQFENALRDYFPGRRFSAGKRVLVKPGTFYTVDRIRGSHYVSWYCVAPRGRDIALACVKFKPRLGCVEIELPIDGDELRAFVGATVFARLNVKPFSNGQFRCVATRLDSVGVTHVAETIKQLAEADIISLPKP